MTTERKAEQESLRQMLVDAPHVENADVEEALTKGLTREDIEWNQRLERDWLYRATDAKAETEARVAYFEGNGVDHADAVERVGPVRGAKK